jgi:hypothetical protein
MVRQRRRPQTGFTTVDIYAFARPSLAVLQDKAHAEGMPEATQNVAASAVVWTAAQLPALVVKAMIEAYQVAYQHAVAEAVGAFIRGESL